PLGGPVALPSRRQRPALLVLRAHASRPRTRPNRRAGLLLRPALRSPRPVRASPAGPRPSARRLVPPTGNDGPRTARALPALFHLVSVLLLFGLLRRQYSGVPALMAALALAVVPMSSYFGKLVNFEPVVLPLMIGLVLASRPAAPPPSSPSDHPP